MKINDDNLSEENYFSGTSTEGTAKERETEVTGEIKIEKEYGLAKPRRKIVRAKIFPK